MNNTTCPHCKAPFESLTYDIEMNEYGRLFLLEDGSVAEWKSDGEEHKNQKFYCRLCDKEIKAKFINGIFTLTK